MKPKLILSLLALLFACLVPMVSAGDTGTYEIQNYQVTLAPQNDGKVAMEITQTWKVTGGYIPWVTVGLPNSDFQVTGFGGAAKNAYAYNGGGWSGARIDLDKDYQPGESFSFSFNTVQENLLENTTQGYRIKYCPGWYDNSVIKSMAIKVISPVNANNVTADPQPTSVIANEIVFQRTNLGKGEKFWITLVFPKNAFSAIPAPQTSSGGWGFLWVIFAIALVCIVGLVIIAIFSDHGGSYSSSYRTGSSDEDDDERERRRRRRSYDDPVVYAGSYHSSDSSSRSSSGGGSFGGRASSCHCACVSCACACGCACACAGGGGAGCAKKGDHKCGKCHASDKTVSPKEENNGEKTDK